MSVRRGCALLEDPLRWELIALSSRRACQGSSTDNDAQTQQGWELAGELFCNRQHVQVSLCVLEISTAVVRGDGFVLGGFCCRYRCSKPAPA